ncbi:TIGR01459 family HAD-type hydrolase [Alphaproteobacteria bacterium]|nr:TIGR01459 family HAD-type hydrolase [Alphaproteobacteria bacterium]
MKKIISIKSICDQYDYFLFDQWGVLHNGLNVFEDAKNCLENLKSIGKKNILISNSSKLTEHSIQNLNNLGINSKLYDYSITSGQIAFDSFTKDIFNIYGDKCFPMSLSNEKIKMFKLKSVKNIKNANFSLIADIAPGSTLFDFTDDLKIMMQLKIPLVCTNPDFQVDDKGTLEMCGGTIAQLFEDMGGTVYRYGKPYDPIYENVINYLSIRSPKKVLAIGDSFNHDILGAMNQGFDSLFIENGIHRSDVKDLDKKKWYLSKFKPRYCQFMLKF